MRKTFIVAAILTVLVACSPSRPSVPSPAAPTPAMTVTKTPVPGGGGNGFGCPGNPLCPSPTPTVAIGGPGGPCPIAHYRGTTGDANGDGTVGPEDLEYLAKFLDGSGPAPKGPVDMDCSGDVTQTDYEMLYAFVELCGPPGLLCPGGR